MTSIPKNIQIPRIASNGDSDRDKNEHVRSNPKGGGELRGRDEDSTIDPARPSAELDWSSSADGRAGRVVDLARPSAELDRFSSADGRAGRMVDPARPSAELDWFSSVDGRAGRFVDPARPSAELDGVLCPPFIETGITYATG
ncbi:hypothetical protein F2Q68_00025106 [Brassica cretica]|uniref:Uncharacterized protein n=1 Tax=Brassica cretica TaxID=69181 RepID=A0A8S9ICB2_BRACR|nr:hypothetical protein F2Q68_00025106 [Brassica cretica]